MSKRNRVLSSKEAISDILNFVENCSDGDDSDDDIDDLDELNKW